jgi:hypothetical protein
MITVQPTWPVAPNPRACLKIQLHHALPFMYACPTLGYRWNSMLPPAACPSHMRVLTTIAFKSAVGLKRLQQQNQLRQCPHRQNRSLIMRTLILSAAALVSLGEEKPSMESSSPACSSTGTLICSTWQICSCGQGKAHSWQPCTCSLSGLRSAFQRLKAAVTWAEPQEGTPEGCRRTAQLQRHWRAGHR